MKQFLAVVLLLVVVAGAAIGQFYEWKAPSIFYSTVDVRGAMTAKKVTCDSLVATGYRGLWKGHDTTDFADLARANTFTGAQTFANAYLNGALVSLGDSSSGDTIRIHSQFLTYNYANTSNWVNLINPGALKRPSSFGHIGVRLYGTGGTGGYFNGLFVNTILDTATASCDVRGAEIKGTSEVTATSTAKLTGLYAKTEMKGTSKTTPVSYGVYSNMDIAATCTQTLGYNFFAEHNNSGTSNAASILGAKANTWLYGLDFNGATFTADARLSNGGTIADTRATLMTITQDTLKLAGSVQIGATTVQMLGIIPSLSGDLDSVGTIYQLASVIDTFWDVNH